MRIDEFAIGFLRNIRKSTEARKIPFLGILMLFSIFKGNICRRPILRDTQINEASFYSTVKTLVSLGFISHQKEYGRSKKKSIFLITDKGKNYLTRILTVRKES